MLSKTYGRKNNCNSCIDTKLQESLLLSKDHAMNANYSLEFTNYFPHLSLIYKLLKECIISVTALYIILNDLSVILFQ